MAEHVRVVNEREELIPTRPGVLRRVSLGSVLAGSVVMLVTFIALAMLGLSIAAGKIDPLEGGNQFRGLGTGSFIWIALSALVSLFVGGLVAGRLAGVPRGIDASLHGIVTWGVASLLTIWFLGVASIGLVRGTLNVLGAGAQTAMQGIGAGASAATGQGGQVDWQAIRREAGELLRDTGKPQLQPDALKQQAQGGLAEGAAAAKEAAQSPQNAGETLEQVLDRVFGRGTAVLEAVDREAIANVLVARTNMSRDEANRTVARWEQLYGDARAQAEQAAASAKQQALEAADAAARTVSRGAAYSFIALVLGAAAAALGGFLGTPRDMRIPTRSEGAAPKPTFRPRESTA